MRSSKFQLLAVILASVSASSAFADMPQGLPLSDVYCAAERCSSVLAAEFYTPCNIPSTKCQCIGYGVGAGYHAPLVFGRVCTWRLVRQGLTWLPASPVSSSCQCGDWLQPSCCEPFGEPAYNDSFFRKPFDSIEPPLAEPQPQSSLFSPPPVHRLQAAPQAVSNTGPTSPSQGIPLDPLPMPRI